jgi:hypothetical protein
MVSNDDAHCLQRAYQHQGNEGESFDRKESLLRLSQRSLGHILGCLGTITYLQHLLRAVRVSNAGLQMRVELDLRLPFL